MWTFKYLQTHSLHYNEYFNVDCQIGTLDVLVGLLDDFSKLDPFVER